MDPERMKRAAEWFYSSVFRDEAIRPRQEQPEEKLPAMLRTARSLEKDAWQSRESVFLKQARLLAAYEDDYDFRGSVTRYFPTYQSLTDRELRGYFAWRTKLRRGELEKTCLSFVYLHIYELLNQVGVADPMEGWRRLAGLRDGYGALDASILPHLNRWMADYVVYYGLDPNLLADSPQVVFDRSLTVLENLRDQPRDKVICAVRAVTPRWLDRSRFYGTHREDCDAVIHRVLCRVADHYDARCKRGFVEQFFGAPSEYPVQLFDTAVFCDPRKVRAAEFCLDERCVYRCRAGLWTVTKHPLPPRPNGKLGAIIKAIDALMREAYGEKPIKYDLDTKWILKLIREEIRAFLEARRAAEARKVTIDFGKLAGIRRDADITRDRLAVDEELEEAPEPVPEPEPAPVCAENDTPLDPAEYRLAQCLLYGRDLGWIQAEGRMLSVLLDSINDKLYDTFLDTVFDDTPAPVEDYIDDLKEMVHP